MRLPGGKKPVNLTNYYNKTVLLPHCDNKCDGSNIELAYPYNKIFNPVNFLFLFLSMQYIRLTTYCHIFVKQLMTDF
jgi:hypothetical protein